MCPCRPSTRASSRTSSLVRLGEQGCEQGGPPHGGAWGGAITASSRGMRPRPDGVRGCPCCAGDEKLDLAFFRCGPSMPLLIGIAVAGHTVMGPPCCRSAAAALLQGPALVQQSRPQWHGAAGRLQLLAGGDAPAVGGAPRAAQCDAAGCARAGARHAGPTHAPCRACAVQVSGVAGWPGRAVGLLMQLALSTGFGMPGTRTAPPQGSSWRACPAALAGRLRRRLLLPPRALHPQARVPPAMHSATPGT